MKKLPIGTIRKYKDGGGLLRNFIILHGHPHSNKGKVIYARWVMEKKIRRFLNPYEIVHHMNGDRLDDRIENLRMFKNQSDHHKNHFINSGSYSENDRDSIIDIIFDALDIYNGFPNIKRDLYY